MKVVIKFEGPPHDLGWSGIALQREDEKDELVLESLLRHSGICLKLVGGSRSEVQLYLCEVGDAGSTNLHL